MLVLGKKIDYALISLAWMSEHDGEYMSAREIAEANGLPLPALMQILKALNQHGVLRSTRGVKGGYQIVVRLENLSLHTLSDMLNFNDYDSGKDAEPTAIKHRPVELMREKLSQFLRDVSIAEVITPGRRVDARKIELPLYKLRVVDRVTV
jgi:Rrf2 family protein